GLARRSGAQLALGLAGGRRCHGLLLGPRRWSRLLARSRRRLRTGLLRARVLSAPTTQESEPRTRARSGDARDHSHVRDERIRLSIRAELLRARLRLRQLLEFICLGGGLEAKVDASSHERRARGQQHVASRLASGARSLRGVVLRGLATLTARRVR